MKPVGWQVESIAGLQDDLIAHGMLPKRLGKAAGISRRPVKVGMTSRGMRLVVQRHVRTLIGIRQNVPMHRIDMDAGIVEARKISSSIEDGYQMLLAIKQIMNDSKLQYPTK